MRWYALGAVAAGVVLALAYGPSYLGYDAAWALVWGADLAGGQLPGYEAAFAPTPHPLANAIALPLSLLADGGGQALGWLAFLGVRRPGGGSVGVRDGDRRRRRRGGRGGSGRHPRATSGVRPRSARSTSRSSRSSSGLRSFAARRGPLSMLPLALLIAGGAAATGGVAVGGRDVAVGGDCRAPWHATAEPRLGLLAALALAAPALWLLSDLVVTGDPLHSLHGTRELASALERPRGAGTALGTLDDGLRDLTGTLPLLAGLTGAGLALWLKPRPATIAAAAVGLGVAGFVVLGAAGLPVLFRYLLVPATLLLVLAGGGFGAALRRSPALAGAAAIAVLLLASLPATADDLSRARDFTALRAEVHDDLLAVARDDAFTAAAARCPEIVVPGFRARPFVLLADPRSRVRVGNLPDGEPGLLITYADQLSQFVFNLGAPGEARQQAAPLDARPVGANASWRAYEVC